MLTGSLIFKRGKTLDLEGYVYARQIIRLTDELNQIQDAQGRRCYKVIIKDLVTSQLEDVKKDINQSPDDVFIVAHGGLDVNGKIWRYDSYQWNSKDTVIEGFDITYDGDLTPIAEFIPINPNDLFGCYISPHVRKVKNGLLSKKRSSIDTFDRLHRRRL